MVCGGWWAGLGIAGSDLVWELFFVLIVVRDWSGSQRKILGVDPSPPTRGGRPYRVGGGGGGGQPRPIYDQIILLNVKVPVVRN